MVTPGSFTQVNSHRDRPPDGDKLMGYHDIAPAALARCVAKDDAWYVASIRKLSSSPYPNVSGARLRLPKTQ